MVLTEFPKVVGPKSLVAQNHMKEFDPEYELHHPLLIVKAVDPGCTLELQIENCRTGQVTRITTTDDSDTDRRAFEEALIATFRAAWGKFK